MGETVKLERLDLTDKQRAELLPHSILLDLEGREIFAGLTREESEWLIADRRNAWDQRLARKRSPADKRRRKELEERHKLGRFSAAGLANSEPEGNA